MYVPDDPPDACPACGDGYESVSRHAGGFVVNLLDNDRYSRVCFQPVESDEGDAALDCYHHVHAEATKTDEEPTDTHEEPVETHGEPTAERDDP
ncbi:hypothetical protein J2751_001514 [Halorubrum alkaliphilum]|uniref:DUF8145 domain-containing protein n=1 Tax=Halorubrum alkaliphilum TaxID=261290 RepID=A0A8T4GDD9_9EURY|nr:hypothetical protein [Halorubrum alkaliphilum]